jgi:predicted acetylornithine/succinylornithine family transaminase
MSHLMNTYGRLPVAFSHGDGSWLTDTDGKVYLDALSGIAVNTLGHNHPTLVAAISAQAGRILHASNLYRIPEQEQLADKLAALSGMDEVFFCNSGCEANEAAIKLARLYGHQQGVDSPATIVMEKAFHGRTMATLSATGNRKAQAGFEPLVSGFVRVPYNNLEAIRTLARYNKNVVAVMLEIVQGEGGINIADIDFQRGLRALCDDRGWLLICDEVQCGMGRTGTWFAFQHAGIRPDVVTLAKGLGGGVPIGACLAAGQAKGLFKPGNHGSTFGGNPLATTAALTTIEVIENDRLIEHALIVGASIREGLAPLFDRTLVMIFEKASTRTRLSFEAGMQQLGGSAIYLNTRDSQLGRGEPVEDAAQVISRMSDIVMIRTFEQSIIERFAEYSRVPVVNGLTNEYHPCQILADIFTFIEHRGPIQGKTVAWVGDSNNVCNTWLQAAEVLDFQVRVSTPPGYEVETERAGLYGTGNFVHFDDPMEACRGADLVTTDVWTSMGFEAENDERMRDFADWQVDEDMMKVANPGAVFMHCLPAHRGEEVSAEVIDGPQSVVWDEAENRLHVQKALMEFLLIGKIDEERI